ncbi:MAG TPA: CHASE3 domain-containing protein, partial [Pyrinomonadaceae bacterium]|nr:CHASE3 domain-containing protein [Pyrinomonadaceae bacterium]
MALKFERQLPLILSAVFILITAIGFVFFQNTANYQEAKNVEKRSMTVLGKMDETLRLTLDIESGSRRFIVIGNETYLQPFNTAKQKLGPSIAQLRTLTAGNPVQTAELDRLEPIVNEYVKEATENVAERKMNGFGSATTELVANRNEMVLSDQIRASIERLKAEELRVLQEKESQLDRNLYFAIWTFIIGSLAGIAALIIANFVVSREIGKRRTAEDALIGANKDLEKRIDERTSELQTVN